MKLQGINVGVMTYLVTLVTIGAGLNFGYETGIMAGLYPMKDFQDRFATGKTTYDANGKFESREWSPWLQGLITGFMSIGCGVGALTGQVWQKRLGTKYSVQLSAIWIIIGCIIKVASNHSWVQFGIGRLVSGYGIGMSSALAPVYQSELMPGPIRGMMGGFFQFAITLGILLAYAIAIGTRHAGNDNSASWRVLVSIGFLFAMLQVGLATLTPESPTISAQKGKYDDAKHAIAVMHGRRVEDKDPHVESEYEDLILRIEEDKASNQKEASWADCFKTENSTCFRTCMGMMLQMGQQLCGGNYFFFYGNQVFANAGLEDSYVTQIILGAVNFVCTAPGLWMVEAWGRRNTLFWGGLVNSLWLFVFAIAGVAGNQGPSLGEPEMSKGMGDLMTVAGCFFVFSLACTWSPAVWIWCSENFGARTRAKQAALSTATNWLWNFMLAFFTQPITSNIGYAYGFIFASWNILNSALVFFFMRETQGLTLEQVDLMYHDPSCKPWNSRTWCPPGYTSRRALVTGEEIAPAVAAADMQKMAEGKTPDEKMPESDSASVTPAPSAHEQA